MIENNDICELLEHTKKVVLESAEKIKDFGKKEKRVLKAESISREIKVTADIILEKKIIDGLSRTGYTILSEETGFVQNRLDSKYRFIVDPLDGTYNFTRGLTPYAISVAFWNETKPIFGIVYDIVNQNLFWGGKKLGAYLNNNQLNVSNISDQKLACLCTGFPANMNLDDKKLASKFWKTLISFSKVRMIGSASMSLVNVASGIADCYVEHEIMIWDVAAGLALVEGAGGKIFFTKGSKEHSMNVLATNKRIQIETGL